MFCMWIYSLLREANLFGRQNQNRKLPSSCWTACQSLDSTTAILDVLEMYEKCTSTFLEVLEIVCTTVSVSAKGKQEPVVPSALTSFVYCNSLTGMLKDNTQ